MENTAQKSTHPIVITVNNEVRVFAQNLLYTCQVHACYICVCAGIGRVDKGGIDKFYETFYSFRKDANEIEN